MTDLEQERYGEEQHDYEVRKGMDEKRFDALTEQHRAAVAALRKTVTKDGMVELTQDLSILKIFIEEAITLVDAGGKSRCRSLVVTKLQEARMWLDEEMKTS